MFLAFAFQNFAHDFLSILVEGMPFLLLGSLISGAVDVFVSSEKLARLLPKNHVLGVLLCGLLGLFLPMCECGSVIVIRRFIRKGLPLSHAVTYMLAAPIVSPLVALSTWAAFQGNHPWEMTSLRLGLGFLLAVGAGFIVGRLPAASVLRPGVLPTENLRRTGLQVASAPVENTPNVDFAEIAGRASFARKWLLVAQSSVADFLDVAFFFIIGAAFASGFKHTVPQTVVAPFAAMPFLSIVALMVLAALLALCSTTDAFVAASLGSFTAASSSSFSLAAKLGFLLFGPMFDVKLFWLYGLLFRRSFIFSLTGGLFIVIALICWRLHEFHIL